MKLYFGYRFSIHILLLDVYNDMIFINWIFLRIRSLFKGINLKNNKLLLTSSKTTNISLLIWIKLYKLFL